jgi:hypothetical protein
MILAFLSVFFLNFLGLFCRLDLKIKAIRETDGNFKVDVRKFLLFYIRSYSFFNWIVVALFYGGV